jgi:hypothetical protein
MVRPSMDDTPQNIVAEITCTQCGTRADTGLIFCKKCGSALRLPAPLIQSGIQDVKPPASTKPKRTWILLKWSLIVTAFVFGYFTWQCGSGMNAAARLSDDAVRRFHSQLDTAAYESIVRESDAAFQNADRPEELLKFLAGVHSKLGTSRSFVRRGIFVNANTNGTFIKVDYTSEFQQGSAIEVFTWRKASDGLKLVGYHIESKAFFTH